jgi:hypothetical protein
VFNFVDILSVVQSLAAVILSVVQSLAADILSVVQSLAADIPTCMSMPVGTCRTLCYGLHFVDILSVVQSLAADILQVVQSLAADIPTCMSDTVLRPALRSVSAFHYSSESVAPASAKSQYSI